MKKRIVLFAACGLVAMLAASASASHSTAIVSDIDGVVPPTESSAVFAGFYQHVSGSSGDHPWYVFNAVVGDNVLVELTTDFPNGSTFWVYDVLDNDVMVGDTPFGGTPDIVLIDQADGPGDAFQSYAFTAGKTGQFVVQVDSWLGGSGNYELSISGLTSTAIPEPSSVALCMGPLVLLGVTAIRRRHRRIG